MTDLYLHIGSNKAGSTAIQTFARNNEVLLKRNDILYPPIGRNGQGAHHPLCFSFIDPQTTADTRYHPRPDAKAIMDEVVKSAASHSRVLISSEALFWTGGLNASAIERFIRNFARVLVIVYLRRNDAYLESMYKSRVRAGDLLPTFETFCEETDRDYWRITAFWESLVGAGNLIVRPFVETVWWNKDLVGDFLRCLDPLLLEQDWNREWTANESDPLPVIDTAMRLRRAGVTDTQRLLSALREIASDYAVTDDAGYLTHDLQERILQRYAASNERLAAKYWSADEATAFFSQPVRSYAKPYQGLTTQQWSDLTAAIWRRVGDQNSPVFDA